MVKPDFFDSGSLAECSHSARLLFIGLWVMGDDNGNVKLSVKKLKKQVFPFDEISDAEFVSMLAELERVGCIKSYSVEGDEYITTVNFKVYQTVKNPSKTTIPQPPESLGKVHRTTRFARGFSDGVALGEEPSCTTATPGLTHDVPPSKEVKKEVSFPPKGEKLTPASDGAAAADAAPPAAKGPTCPACGGSMRYDESAMLWLCSTCDGTLSFAELIGSASRRRQPPAWVCPVCESEVSCDPETGRRVCPEHGPVEAVVRP